MDDVTVIEDGRVCIKCGQFKPASEFFLDKRRKYGSTKGLRSWCRACTGDDNRKRRAEDPEKFRQWERRSSELRFDEQRAAKRERHLAYRTRLRGITVEEFWAMMEAQGNACAICSAPVFVALQGRGQRSTACLDHDHETGRVRGILCNSCNSGLGHFKDDAGLLGKAVEYLKK